MKPENKLNKLVLELEENAESENYHDLYSIYRDLSDIVVKHAGVDIAIKVIQDVLDRNGFMR